MKIPSDNRWTQTNEGNIFGVLRSTKNIAKDKGGVLALSKKSFSIYNSGDDGDFGTVLAIKYFGNEYYVVTSDEIFSGDLDTGAFTEVASVASPTVSGDAEIVFGKLYVTRSNNFANSDDYTASLGSLTSSVPHPIAIFDSLPTHKLAIGNGSSVKTYDSSHSAGQTLTLPSQFEVECLEYRNGYLYVGTSNKNGGEARIFVWDGNTGNANFEVPVGANRIYAFTPYQTTVALVTSEGQVGIVNGSTFSVLANFPVFSYPDMRWQGTLARPRVNKNGMMSIGNDIYIVVDGRVEDGFIPEQKGGVWVYDPNTGLSHRSGASTDSFVADTGVTASNSILTTTSAHNLTTGDVVMFSTVSGLSGVLVDVPYYASVQSTTTLKIARTRKALEAGNFVTITGTATTDTLLYVENTDKGDVYDVESGAIARTTDLDSSERIWQSAFIWGCTIETKDGSSFSSLNGFVDSFNIGVIETQKLYTANIKQTWQDFVVFVKGILYTGEKAILKYKRNDQDGKPTTVLRGVWGTTNTIHSNPSTLGQDPWEDIEVGDEINIVQGYGRGYTAHVTDIATSVNTTVLTLDESVGTVGQPVYFYADSYVKVKEITKDRQETAFLEFPIGAVKSTAISYKVELRGFETEVTSFDISNVKDR